jgi:hypothetical protein
MVASSRHRYELDRKSYVMRKCRTASRVIGVLRAWRAWHREQREAVLAGPHGAVLGERAHFS